MSVALKIKLSNGAVKTMRFTSEMSVSEACDQIFEKASEGYSSIQYFSYITHTQSTLYSADRDEITDDLLKVALITDFFCLLWKAKLPPNGWFQRKPCNFTICNQYVTNIYLFFIIKFIFNLFS